MYSKNVESKTTAVQDCFQNVLFSYIFFSQRFHSFKSEKSKAYVKNVV